MKKLLALFLVVLMSIESFAAVVSDNDGSAFITKAEFDSLKNDFQSQLDLYNSSIDSKIDNAIASYLAGIKVNVEPINLIERFEEGTGKKQVWLYELPGVGVSSVTNNVLQTVDCEFNIERCNNLTVKTQLWEGAANQSSYWWSTLLWPSSYWRDNTGWNDTYAKATAGSFDGYIGYKDLPTGNFSGTPTTTSPATYAFFPQNTTTIERSSTGAGSGWLWQNFGNGKYNLKYYCAALYPNFNVVWRLHYYKKFPVTTTSHYYTASGLTTSGLSMTENSTLESVWGATNAVGSQASSRTDKNLRNYAQISSSLVKTNNGTNYLNYVWGLDANTQIYGNDEDYIPNLSSSDLTLQTTADTKYQNQAFQKEGLKTFESSYPIVRQKVKLRKYDMIHLPLSYFSNNTLSNIAATETVYNGNGAPCYNCPDDDIKARGKIKLTTTSGSCHCNVKISDKPFNNGNIASDGHEILNITISTGVEESFALENMNKGNYYIFIKNNTNTNPITVELFEVKK